MAKYDVTYKCGHTGVVQLYGKHEDRYRKIEWMQNNIMCPKCIEKIHDEENDKAEKIALEHGLAQLIGSDKQVKWANTIRNNVIYLINEKFDENSEKEMKIKQWFLDHTKASWWIENRNYSVLEIINLCEKEIASFIGTM